jgi:hypothetical protein
MRIRDPNFFDADPGSGIKIVRNTVLLTSVSFFYCYADPDPRVGMKLKSKIFIFVPSFLAACHQC